MLPVRTQVFCLALAVFKDGRSLVFRSVLPGCGAHILAGITASKCAGFPIWRKRFRQMIQMYFRAPATRKRCSVLGEEELPWLADVLVEIAASL